MGTIRLNYVSAFIPKRYLNKLQILQISHKSNKLDEYSTNKKTTATDCGFSRPDSNIKR